MFDQFSTQFMQIFSMTVGGVSVATILANVVYCVKCIGKMRKENKLTKENMEEQIQVTKDCIEQSFKSAVLPQKIKLDISSKIEQPLKEGFAQLQSIQQEQLAVINSELTLILKILSKFSHTQKLTEDEQDELKELVGEMVVEETTL